MNDTTTSIYKIQNTANNKCYIGVSIGPKKRFYNHKYHLKRGTHPNKEMQDDYTKLAKRNEEVKMIFQVLVDNVSVRDVSDLEIEYINKKDAYENGYNSKLASPYGKSDIRKKRTNTQRIEREKRKWTIKECRINSGLSIEEISQKLGVSCVKYQLVESENVWPTNFFSKIWEFGSIVDVPDGYINHKGNEEEEILVGRN